ncbi:hypothetical protein [uncultured Gemmiger sp.]|uniref:hypothetical protein n=1 Tax=uncultured Gemmiger sp. TaxID=1623490 RepID=UPI00259842E7|nr:hypothetical protein [uncultured Gemmiger sp.]
MKKNFPILVSLVLLTACTSAPADSAAATPEPTATPVITPEPTPSPTPAPTMAVYDEVSFDDWKALSVYPMPDYTFSAPHKPQPQEQVTWPEDGTVRLCASWNGTLEEAAETFGIPEEELQAMNPDCAWDGRYDDIRLQVKLYTLPYNNVVTVTVTRPQWDSYCTKFDVPASLDKQAQAALATAYAFQYRYYGMSTGLYPSESVDDPRGYYTSRAADGAAFVKYSDLDSFLHTVYSDALASEIAGGPDAPYIEGEDDSILFRMGDRGSNILYCGTLFTEPELQPDGSLEFWQLSLQLDDQTFEGWGGEGPYIPTDAFAKPVRLIPTEGGWRVDALELPN